jgi:hypothetical protein
MESQGMSGGNGENGDTTCSSLADKAARKKAGATLRQSKGRRTRNRNIPMELWYKTAVSVTVD